MLRTAAIWMLVVALSLYVAGHPALPSLEQLAAEEQTPNRQSIEPPSTRLPHCPIYGANVGYSPRDDPRTFCAQIVPEW